MGDTVTELRHILGVFTARAERDRHSKTGNAAIVLTYDDAAAVVRERIDALAAVPVAVPDGLTDLPDAETAIRTILREHTHKLGVCCRCGYGEGEQFAVSEHRHRAHVASVIATALAAASGPWAEQLDAAKAERDECERQFQEKVRDLGREMERVDRLAADLDAALARNAELEAEVQNIAGGALVEEAETSVRRIHAEVERDVARQALTSADAMNRHWDEINAHRDLLVAERDALQARVNELEGK